MVYSDNIYENTGYILRNLNTSATQSKGTWVSGTGYGFYGTYLEKPLTMNHLYYQRYYYKFTTTNQSPSWVSYYLYGGMQGGAGKWSGLTANTEYLISDIAVPNMGAGNGPRSMTIFNGDWDHIDGVTSYVKDVLVYDVTDLYNILRAKGVISNSHSALKTWCDNNLQYVPTNKNYDITEHTILLPKGYQQLQYIESTGSQWIDTGVLINSSNYNKIRYILDCKPTSTAVGNLWWAHGIGGGSVNTFHVGIGNGSSSSYPFTYGNGYGDTVTSAYGNIGVRYIWDYDTSQRTYKVYDESYNLVADVSNTVLNAPTDNGYLSLFCWRRYTGSVGYCHSDVFYKCIIYDSGKMIRMFIPAKRTSDSTIGLFDIVNSTFYANSGSGAFTAGAVISTSNIDTPHFTSGGVSCSEIIEPDSMTKYSCNSTIATYTFFDTGSGIYVYNNNGNGTVTHTRVAASTQNSPFVGDHPYILKITTNGSASPYAGGFYTNHVAAANKVFIEKFVAKVPIGYEVTAHYNSQGSGASVYWITPTAGTGDWEEYAVLYRCGSSGSFSTGGHIALNGSNNTSVTWYVAYVNDCDITGHEELMNYKILPSQTSMKGGKIFSGEFNTANLLTNGDCHVQDSASLPGGWYYDTSDYAGDATCSLVQPVGAGAGIFGPMLPVDPMNRYKVSFWVKCKQDMSSFLTAICYYTSDGRGPWIHQEINYYAGTKTTLSSALNSGDTQITVASNSNWASRSYSRLGFRSSIYNVSYNNVGTSHGYSGSTGLIKGTSGSNVVTFNTPYSGSTIPAGTCVVESYDGDTYPYPIHKGNLPTDNTWKYVEGYFGSQEALWDGAGSWNAIPADMRYIRLFMNIYSNDGSVPIKYSDIRIVPVAADNSRLEKKVSITC